MRNRISLLVGLGNPGDKYEFTRHNIGRLFVSRICKQYKIRLKFAQKFQGLHTRTALFDKILHILIPNTYMNLSGNSLYALLKYYAIPVENTLVMHDDLDITCGTSRLKLGGGTAGHHGLDHIIKTIGCDNFLRLRIGISRPKDSEEIAEYVLDRPRYEEWEKIEESFAKIFELFPQILEGEIAYLMQRLHS